MYVVTIRYTHNGVITMKVLIGLTMAGTIGSLVIGNLMNVVAQIQAALNNVIL